MVKDLELVGANGTLLVNGAKVSVSGLTLTSQSHGGIEVSKGVNVETNPELTVDGEILHDLVDLPIIWIDGFTENNDFVLNHEFEIFVPEGKTQLWFTDKKTLIEIDEFHESFDDTELTSSYSSGEFTSTEGLVWKYDQARGEEAYAIAGKGIMFGTSSEAYLETTFISSGGYFNFEFRKAFTGSNARQLEVYVNDEKVSTTNSFGAFSGAEDIVYHLEVEINVVGPVTIRIANAGTQITIDNVRWTKEGAPTRPVVTLEIDTNETKTINVTNGEKLPTTIEPTKEGYNFLGWTLEDDTEFDLETVITEDITLVAKWELIITHTVTFNADNETDLVNVDVENGNAVTKPANPIKTGFKFLGWFLGETEFDFATEITEDITLIAKWEESDEPAPERLIIDTTQGGYPTSYDSYTWTFSDIVFEGTQLTKNGNAIQGNQTLT